MIIVHFEVYVLESRGWMLHARFPRLDRDEAMHEARELEASMGLRVKVLRETYNTDTNNFDEVEVYVSGNAPPPPKSSAPAAKKAQPSRRTPPPKARIRAAPPLRAKPKDDSFASAFAVVSRLTLILLAAVGLGLMSLRLMQSTVLALYDYGFRITPDDYNHLQLGLFLLVVALVAVPLGLRFLPTHALLPKGTGGASAPGPYTDPKLKKSLNKLVARVAAEGGAEPTIPDRWEDDPKAVAPLPLDLAFGAATEPSEPTESAPPEPPPAALAPPPPPPPAAPSVPPAIAAATELCERFLEGAIRAAKATGMAFDQYQRFALNLYMAGAVGALAELHRLDDATRRRLLAQAFDRLESSADMAARFESRMAEYMMEPRYMRLIQAGRAGIEMLGLGAGVGAHSVLTSILKDWNRPATEKKASIMTVMFTDMVGSTDMTQARGDVAAQEIVRRHNAIVRTSLAQFSGKEIKHTGDGIMASFASAANAVEASIQIHREVAAHNAGRPDLPLHLRIGLNAGEPIQEEDDLFGVTVQLAARVCAATQSDRTLCTTVVKDLASGKGGAFDSAGSFALKGFRDKIPLWDVVWR
ncbi:Adenylate cyclase, class 3 [Magnetospirillum fulvum]|uniref:Adenylate cyclase, class 3 n=2 Tax=Magnetospirillum fulvum TaxID=1082 RepID=A0A1H6IMF1_MAGFU|nr:Adenylate cyclase, class 3 [Magnetospirillum fulvum]